MKRSFVICNLHHLLHDKFKGHVGGIEGKCSWSENPEKRYDLGDLGVGRSMILKWTERRNKQRREEREGNGEREV
jgi:hypothetical protein